MDNRIKYRIWDKEEECWYEPAYDIPHGMIDELTLCPTGDLVRRNMHGNAAESTFPNRYDVNPYTGSKDEDGIEVAEGDIVIQWDFLKDHSLMRIAKPKPIVATMRDVVYLEYTGAWHGYRVIGNIYQHPQMLTQRFADLIMEGKGVNDALVAMASEKNV